MKFALPILSITAALANLPTGASARSFQNSVTTTVGWSEWCPPGMVTVDLDTGLYRWVQQLPRPLCRPNSAAPVLSGTLATEKLEAIRNAARIARGQGLARVECAAGKSSERIVFSNGGSAYLLTLVDPKGGIAAPGDLSCWSDAAFQLQRVLDREFDVSRRSMRISP